MLPSVVFVLGKGGVGRSTVAAALGAGLAARGKRVFVAQWAIADTISPWFDREPASYDPRLLAPGLKTSNFTAEAALEQYFVVHLKMRRFYRLVIANRHVQRATRAAPGLEELMFLGMINWLAQLQQDDVGWTYDHVIVDAPAMGHGASLLGVPRMSHALGLGGLLATETARVAALLAEPARSGAIVVTTPDELAVEETCEFWPRITAELERPPLAIVINRSVRALGPLPIDARACGWLAAIAPPDGALDSLYVHCVRRADRERELAMRFTTVGARCVVSIDDAWLVDDSPAPRRIVEHAAGSLAPLWEAA